MTKMTVKQQDKALQVLHEAAREYIFKTYGVKYAAKPKLKKRAAPCPPASGTLPMFGMPPVQPNDYLAAAELLVFPEHPDYAASVKETVRLLSRNNASSDVDQMKGYAVAVQASEVLDNPGRVPYTQPAIIDSTYPAGYWTKEQQLVWMTPGHPYGFPYILEALYQALKAAVNAPPAPEPEPELGS